MRELIIGAAIAFGLIGVTALEAQGPGRGAGGGAAGRGAAAQQQTLQQRVVQANPGGYNTSNSVHQGAGPMAFGTVLGGGAVPGLGFIHRGRIPPGGGIGVHFHLSSE